ncbi:MAG: flagellar hook-associated protein FlgK [Lachnospiraceae bacterium]|nr:flagellar hook-associated protein FlgK [Lachnospiraceae bacterium]
MTSIYTGVSGLQANQNALNVTAHNLANVNTEGYVRQQAGMADGIYLNYGYSAVNTKQVGLGVVSAESRHIRDLLLDKAYREQSGRKEFYASKATATEEIETILGELEGIQFQESLKELKEAISEMAKTPDSTVTRSGLIMSAEAFLIRANAVYEEIISYQQTLDRKITDTVDRINAIGDEIYRLNLEITKIEAPGFETASDLRDQRDLLLDELSSLVKLDYSENEYGIVTVKIEGTTFVTKDGVFKMGTAELYANEGSSYISPVWPHIDDVPVFDVYAETSTAKNNDIGELKGLLIARGGYVATYQDVPHEPDYTQFATDAEKVAAFNQYQKDVTEYNQSIGNTVVAKTQALFDQMIKHIVTTINDLLSPTISKTLDTDVDMTIKAGTVVNTLDKALQDSLAGQPLDENGALVTDTTVTLATGTTITILNVNEDENGCSFGCDENKTPGTELFSREEVERYTVAEGSDGVTYYIYNPYNEFGNESYYSLGNLKVNPVVVDDYSYLPFTTVNEDIDMRLGQAILEAWDVPSLNLDPNNVTPKDFDDYYTAMIGVISNDGYIYSTVEESQGSVVLNIDNKRISKTGVSSEEELSNMIRFKNAYDASSRYINAITEMLDTLINKVGNY